jgi:hypothetical protein
MQMAWLKSIVEDGPTDYCTDMVASALIRKGVARSNGKTKLEASDLGRQVILAAKGEKSTLVRA